MVRKIWNGQFDQIWAPWVRTCFPKLSKVSWPNGSLGTDWRQVCPRLLPFSPPTTTANPSNQTNNLRFSMTSGVLRQCHQGHMMCWDCRIAGRPGCWWRFVLWSWSHELSLWQWFLLHGFEKTVRLPCAKLGRCPVLVLTSTLP